MIQNMLYLRLYRIFLSAYFLTIPITASAAKPLNGLEDFCAFFTVPELSRRQTVPNMLKIYQNELNTGKRMRPVEIPITFEGVPEGKDIYNPAGFISTKLNGKPIKLFAARVEGTASETDMFVGFFSVNEGKAFSLLETKIIFGPGHLPFLALQDPFYTTIQTENGKELLFGGVSVFEKFVNGNREIHYHTVFYRDFGRGVDHLKKVIDGPARHKDIRIQQKKDGSYVIFTRPQNGNPLLGGLGKVGVTFANRLEDITPELIQNAPILKGQLFDDEWSGVNATYQLKNGLIGLLGHVAMKDAEGNRHYYAVAWAHDPTTGWYSEMEIIFERRDLPNGIERGAKFESLKDIIFSGQLIRHGNGTATLVGGGGDIEVFQALITDPLAKFEKMNFAQFRKIFLNR